MKHDHPLLLDAALPPFSQIRPEQIEPALDAVLAKARAARDAVLAESDPPSWSNFIEPLNQVDNQLSRLWSIVSHLHHVQDTEDLRAVYQACLPKLMDYSTEMAQDPRLYARLEALATSLEADVKYSDAQRKLVANQLRDFRLAGVHLEDQSKSKLAACFQELARLGHRFDNHVLDATAGWVYHTTHADELVGIPELIQEGAQQTAQQRGLEGWVLSLDQPVYMAVMQHAQSSKLRQQFYTAYVTRASDQGPNAGQWDNAQIASDILMQRAQVAKLLGYDHYAQVSLATKMAASTEEVMDFIESLEDRLLNQARSELAQLEAFAQDTLSLDALAPWDIAFASEAFRKAHYALDQEQLRSYFPLPKVLEGLFRLTQTLFDIRVERQSGVDVWDKSVACFAVRDGRGDLMGQFYLDPCARRGKQAGAWVSDYCERYRSADGRLQTPVAFVNCNFNPAKGKQPPLLTHDDVLTLFHEFGHCLHHMLSTVEVLGVSGTAGVPWDCVEMPSQIMELWCWSKPVLAMISGHVETGEALPDDVYERLLSARHFQSGLRLMRQLFFARFDFSAHQEAGGLDVDALQALADATRKRDVVTPSLPIDRFQNSFSHIFAGGYAAGYYSYLWAEILSSDAFAKFEECGDVLDPKLGAQLRQAIFAVGGSRDFGQCFETFRGRPPQQTAFLRHHGVEQ